MKLIKHDESFSDIISEKFDKLEAETVLTCMKDHASSLQSCSRSCNFQKS